MKRCLILLLAFTGCLLIYSGCNPKEGYNTFTGVVMGYSFKIVYQTPAYAPWTFRSDLKRELNKTVQDIDKSLSLYYKGSVINQVNTNKITEADSLFITVFKETKRAAHYTGAALNITSRPLQQLWGYNLIHYQTITEEQIEKVLPYVGFDKVHLENGKIVKDDPRISINLNTPGIGYSVDLFAHMLNNHKVINYMIEAGEVICCKGVNPSGAPWRIQLDRESTHVLYMEDKCVTVHGKLFELIRKDNKLYSYLFDPRTGYPFENKLVNVVVVADKGLTSALLSLSLFSMGLEKSIAFIEAHPAIQGLLFYCEDDTIKTYITPNISKRHETQYFP